MHRGVAAVLRRPLGGRLLRLCLLDDAEALASEEAEEVGADLLGVRLDLPQPGLEQVDGVGGWCEWGEEVLVRYPGEDGRCDAVEDGDS